MHNPLTQNGHDDSNRALAAPTILDHRVELLATEVAQAEAEFNNLLAEATKLQAPTHLQDDPRQPVAPTQQSSSPGPCTSCHACDTLRFRFEQNAKRVRTIKNLLAGVTTDVAQADAAPEDTPSLETLTPRATQKAGEQVKYRAANKISAEQWSGANRALPHCPRSQTDTAVVRIELRCFTPLIHPAQSSSHYISVTNIITNKYQGPRQGELNTEMADTPIFPSSIADTWRPSFYTRPRGQGRGDEMQEETRLTSCAPVSGMDPEITAWDVVKWSKLGTIRFRFKQNARNFKAFMVKRTGRKQQYYRFTDILVTISRYIDEESLKDGDNRSIVVPNRELRKLLGDFQAAHWSRLPGMTLKRLDTSEAGTQAHKFESFCHGDWTMKVETEVGLEANPHRDIIPILDWAKTKETGKFACMSSTSYLPFPEILRAVLEYINDRCPQLPWDIVYTRGTYLEQTLKTKVLDKHQIPELLLNQVTWNHPITTTRIRSGQTTGGVPRPAPDTIRVEKTRYIKGTDRNKGRQHKCWNCGTQDDSGNTEGAGMVLLACQSCRIARYCGKGCQVEDWDRHKEACTEITEKRYWRRVAGTQADEVD